jgi:uracil-DNA glycosylase family 4
MSHSASLEIDEMTARALLEWQAEMGADEAMHDAPINRYSLPQSERGLTGASAAPPEAPPRPERTPPNVEVFQPLPMVDPLAVARAAAKDAADLAELAQALAAFEHCDLRMGARNLVFSDGLAGARVMIIGEAPGREEDIEGRPFVGRAGQLLDKMFAAIGLSRTAPAPENALYITNVLPWRPPGNREPEPAEIALLRPFLERHVALAAPDLIVLMGNAACMAALGQRGVLRLRGHWMQAFGCPALPMTHPAYLLRQPQAKREAWADLLSLRSRLGS